MKRSKWWRIFILLSLPVILLSHCSSKKMAYEAAKRLSISDKPHPLSELKGLGYMGQDADGYGAAPASSVPHSFDRQFMNESGSSGIDRYLIKNAQLTLEVKDSQKTTSEINRMFQTLGGYLSDMRENVDGLGRRFCTLQIRIPSTQLDSFLSGMEQLGKLEVKQVTSEDLTEQYIDLKSRLKNLKQTEERLLEHLARTGSLEDILKVEREISRVRGEIEGLEGRERFLSHRIEFSTVSITLYESPQAASLIPVKSFSTGKVFSEATRVLILFVQKIWILIIWAGVWAVLWIPCIFIIRFAYRYQRKNMDTSSR